MKKNTGFILQAAFAVFTLAMSGGNIFAQQQPQTIRFAAITGPSGVGLIRIFDAPPSIAGYTLKSETISQADIMASRMIAGEIDIGVLPANVAAKIAASGKNIQLAAVIGNGMLKLLTGDAAVTTIEDLRGKEVFCAGQGATPEYVFKQILRAKNINPDKDIKLNFSLAYPEIAQSLIAGKIKYALLPEPFATMAKSGNAAIVNIDDIQKEWAAAEVSATGGKNVSNYPMTVLVVSGDFAAKNKKAVEAFLKAAEASIKWTVSHPAEAGALVEKHNLGLKASVVEKAIPNSNYVYNTGDKARLSIEALFHVFLSDSSSASAIGGKLPPDSFYYK
jgi:NitT/TauT family transport system substrate-binding protein